MHAHAREESLSKLPESCIVVVGNALEHLSFANQIAQSQTFIQFIGVPHPSPAKKELLKKIDFVSIRESVLATQKSGIEHFIFVSVAQETNLMQAYQEVRKQGEELIRTSGMNATILMPW